MGDFTLDEGEANLPIKGGVPKNSNISPDILLKDGDEVGSLRVIAVPGHTPGLLAYLDTRDNAVIVGDALQIRGGVAVAGDLKVLFPFPALATWNKKLAIDSAIKLVELKPTLLACGHGNMLKAPEVVMKKAIINAQKKIDKLQERMK